MDECNNRSVTVAADSAPLPVPSDGVVVVPNEQNRIQILPEQNRIEPSNP
jgi:hypothetical protein